MQTQGLVKLLDEVITGLKKAEMQTDAATDAGIKVAKVTAGESRLADAIDRELGATPRQTSVTRVRADEALARFHGELETESLTVTTVTSLLQVVRQALEVFGVLKA